MSESAFTILTDQLTCFECGIEYAVPTKWLEGKIKNGESIKCPNGHDQHYCTPSVDNMEKENAAMKKEIEELKLRLFQALHDSEQNEGRRAAQDIEPDSPAPVATSAAATVSLPTKGRAMLCPRCSKPYKTAAPLVNHFRQFHPGDPLTEQIAALAEKARAELIS